MICTGGTNNCLYRPTDVQCVNATYNGTDGLPHWQIACGDPKMSPDLCFNSVNLTCTNLTLNAANGTTGGANVTADPICKLEYAIDRVRDSNCTAALTFPQQYVSNSATKSGSGGGYWALLIVPIGLALVLGVCWFAGKNKRSAAKDVYSSNVPQYGAGVDAPLYESDQPYPTGAQSYASQAAYPAAPYAATGMPQYPSVPSAPYPPAGAPPYQTQNAAPYPTGVQPPYPVAPY